MSLNLRVLSLGAGVQSTVLALMAVEGVLPKPDLAIFADTGWEPRRVYEHLAKLGDVMWEAGIRLAKVSKGNLRTDTIDPLHRYASIPYFVKGPCTGCEATGKVWDLRFGPAAGEDNPELVKVRGWLGLAADTPRELVPSYTGLCPRCDGTGIQLGMGRRQCTSEYKLAPINRHVRSILGATPPDYRRVPKGNNAEQWIGFSSDEIGRVSDHGVSYITKRYPLIEMGMTRSACVAWLGRRGWSTVEKSACIGCPYHGNEQWRALRDTCRCGHHRSEHWQGDNVVGPCERLASSPEAGRFTHGMCGCHEFIAPEWDDAVAFDAAIRKGGARGLPLDGEAFLHRSRVPLSIAPIDRRTRGERRGEQLDLIDELGDPDGCGPYSCRSGLAVTG